MRNTTNHIWDDQNNPELWKHLMKDKCVVCRKKVNEEGQNTQADYIVRGNYCQKCNNKASEAKWIGEGLADLFGKKKKGGK